VKALIVGNGLSRKDINLEQVARTNDQMTIYGCNALYRDYGPDYLYPDWLVAIDDGVIDEIKKSDFPSHRLIVPPEKERWEPVQLWEGVGVGRPPRSNAGTNAIIEAVKMRHDTIYIVGFDSMIRDHKVAVGNIYDATENYGPETRANYNDSVFRARYLAWVFESNPNVKFRFYFPNGYEIIQVDLPNVSYHDYVVL
tara:strand:+ start:96 stop:686 length:591 start_codon:yes stop_codon:yes gene_type:complete